MKWFERKQILVPFDFSEACVGAVNVAIELATNVDDVHVLHVLETLPATSPLAVWDPDADDKRKVTVRATMNKALSGLNIKHVHLDVSIGNPARKVAEFAKEIGCGLIVVPSNSRSPLQRIFIGSVAERVVRLAPCPVLVLKSNEA